MVRKANIIYLAENFYCAGIVILEALGKFPNTLAHGWNLHTPGKWYFEFLSGRRYPALGHLVFFLSKKKINIFRHMHIALFLSDLLNPNFVDKNWYSILFLLESYFFDKQSKFLDVRFYWNKKVKYGFIYERKLK